MCFDICTINIRVSIRVRACFQHVNCQKRSDTEVFCAFWLRTVLPDTTACIFSDVSTAKSDPTLRCFARFDFETRCAPQLRAFFRHFNFQKWSAHEVFGAFWFGNVLRAATACIFFISHPARWPPTHRFSEPTFPPSGATNHYKNTVIRNFSTFSRTCIFFLLTLSLLWYSLSSSLLFSSLTLPPSAFPSVLSEVWLLNFLRLWFIPCYQCTIISCPYFKLARIAWGHLQHRLPETAHGHGRGLPHCGLGNRYFFLGLGQFSERFQP